MAYIYALCDPETGEVRYIGSSEDPEGRLRQHMTPSQLREDTLKTRWLKSLKEQGRVPKLIILDEIRTFYFGAILALEYQWIQEYSTSSANLTNLAGNPKYGNPWI